MQALLFYLVYPFIYIVASLPFSILYFVSDVFYYLLKLSGYRKKVVLTNLMNAFPEKSSQEINATYNKFYSYLCDLIFETVKTLTMTEKEARERCTFRKSEWLEKLHQENKSIIVVLGHYGNWEWAGPSFTLNTNYQLVVVYRPLSNPYFERMMCKARTKFGTKITPVNNTLRDMVANRNKVTATALIADQSSSPETAYWMNFLNQDTATFTGPEKLAKKFNYPVVYMNIKRLKRGYYEVVPELMFENLKEVADGEIIEAFNKRLEQEIKLDPIPWLWSHRRWKHKRKK